MRPLPPRRTQVRRPLVCAPGHQLAIEPLEHRRVLTAGLQLSVVDQVLSINGTAGDDLVVIRQQGGELSVMLASAEGILSTSLPAGSVRAIRFDALAGNDTFVNASALPAIVDGGPGNDSLRGGRGPDVILGGDGNDLLVGDAGDDVLDGDCGHDFLEGNDGDDLLIGGDGDDEVYGGPGDDILRGGDGNDLLVGDGGLNILLGDAGDNRLAGIPASDRIAESTEPADEPVPESKAGSDAAAAPPVADEPVADEPVADEPVADEPVADEPVADEPVQAVAGEAVNDGMETDVADTPAETAPSVIPVAFNALDIAGLSGTVAGGEAVAYSISRPATETLTVVLQRDRAGRYPSVTVVDLESGEERLSLNPGRDGVAAGSVFLTPGFTVILTVRSGSDEPIDYVLDLDVAWTPGPPVVIPPSAATVVEETEPETPVDPVTTEAVSTAPIVAVPLIPAGFNALDIAGLSGSVAGGELVAYAITRHATEVLTIVVQPDHRGRFPRVTVADKATGVEQLTLDAGRTGVTNGSVLLRPNATVVLTVRSDSPEPLSYVIDLDVAYTSVRPPAVASDAVTVAGTNPLDLYLAALLSEEFAAATD
jgi:Ca2+-binding RTX toxin-like protein